MWPGRASRIFASSHSPLMTCGLVKPSSLTCEHAVVPVNHPVGRASGGQGATEREDLTAYTYITSQLCAFRTALGSPS